MPKNDARGVPTSTGSEASIEAFETALAQFHCYRGDPVATIDMALANEPDFVMGHVLRAEMHVCLWERSVLPEVRKSLDRLAELSNSANERERGHTAAIAAWVEGDWEGYRARLDQVLFEQPRDALALQTGHLADFFHGDRDNLRGRVLRCLPAWSLETPGYGFVQGMLSFGQEECGDYARAEESGRHAIELEPDDCWAQHAVAHVMEMQGRQAEGIAFMESRSAHWAQEDNAFSFHNWWHTALYNLDQDRIERVLALYDTRIRPRSSEGGGSEIQMEMLDATALLWRLHLRGIDVGGRWQELAATYESCGEDGFYVFNDMHAMMALVADGRQAAADRLLKAVEAAAAQATNGGGSNAAMSRAVGLPIVRAIEAYGRGRYAEAVELLMPVRYRAHAFGGSHAQRDVVHRTLMEAAIRGGNYPLAKALTAERTALKPHCPFSWAQRRRAETGQGKPSFH